MKLSIIIPAKNEEKRIRKTLESYLSYFQKKFKNDFSILVVLNGCTDNTLFIIKEIKKKHKQLEYKDIKEAIGKGKALIIGFHNVNADFIGYVDADLSTSPETFDELLPYLENFDGAIASRWIKGAFVSPKQPLLRRIASRSFNLLTQTLFGLSFRDSQCGAKVFRKKALFKVYDELAITNWAFDVNLLFLLKIHGFHVKEVPTTWKDSLGSQLKIHKASVQMFFSLLRLRLLYSPFSFVVKTYDQLPEEFKLHHHIK